MAISQSYKETSELRYLHQKMAMGIASELFLLFQDLQSYQQTALSSIQHMDHTLFNFLKVEICPEVGVQP
jgi:hypothetical protein